MDGMAIAIWEHVGGDSRLGRRATWPQAADEAAEALANLFEESNGGMALTKIASHVGAMEDRHAGEWMARAALLPIAERRKPTDRYGDIWKNEVRVPVFDAALEGDDLAWEGDAAANRNPSGPLMAYPCTDCGGHGPHEGPGHAYTTAQEPGGLMEHACTDCGGRGRHGAGGHPYTTAPPKENPVGDHVDVVAGPGRGRRGVVTSETPRVARIAFDKGGSGHVERSALRTRGGR